MNNIDLLAQTKTTAQIIHYYRTNDMFDLLERDLESCTKGMYLAIQHILCKGVVTPRIPTPERAEMELKDVVESLRNDS